MASRTVFCSYARGDTESVHAIAAELDQLGQQAWIDQKLSGGQTWWDTILGQIRTCDCFLFALSDASLQSKACQAELDYAHRLGRIILPVSVGPVVDALLPPHLAEIQRIEAGDTRMLARALLGLPPRPPLPDPLPDPPPVPITYLTSLAAILDRDELTPADQRNLEGSLKQRLGNPEERDAAVALLRRLRRHPSVTAFVAGEIDADLAAIEPPPTHTAPAPAPAPRPDQDRDRPRSLAAREPETTIAGTATQRRVYVPAAQPDDEPSHSGGGRGGLLIALALVVVLALGGLAVWALATGDSSQEGDEPTVTTLVDEPVSTSGSGGGGGGGGSGTTRGGSSGGASGGTGSTTTTTSTVPPTTRGPVVPPRPTLTLGEGELIER